jgi:hypothetical protein
LLQQPLRFIQIVLCLLPIMVVAVTCPHPEIKAVLLQQPALVLQMAHLVLPHVPTDSHKLLEELRGASPSWVTSLAFLQRQSAMMRTEITQFSRDKQRELLSQARGETRGRRCRPLEEVSFAWTKDEAIEGGLHVNRRLTQSCLVSASAAAPISFITAASLAPISSPLLRSRLAPLGFFLLRCSDCISPLRSDLRRLL